MDGFTKLWLRYIYGSLFFQNISIWMGQDAIDHACLLYSFLGKEPPPLASRQYKNMKDKKKLLSMQIQKI